MVAIDGYALGHADAEMKRLAAQARLIDPITRRFLVSAGITEGMRVLDVGSGAGDVAILLAGLVGPTGEIVGTPQDANRMQMPFVAQTALLGGAVNVGLEDNIGLDRGVPASDGGLVARAREDVERMGGSIATAAEARATLELKKQR